MHAFYLNLVSQTSFNKTKQTLNAPFTPNPAIILKAICQVISKVKLIPIIPKVVTPQLEISVFLRPA